jgi:hypothetical protein
MIPGRRPTLSDRIIIAKMYAALADTDYGSHVISRAKEHGLPKVIFNEKLKPGKWGVYYHEEAVIHLNSVYRTLPPEVGASVLAHELLHHSRRSFKKSQAGEFEAHYIEAMAWKELRERGAAQIHPEYTRTQMKAIFDEEDILYRATHPKDATALLEYIETHPTYGDYQSGLEDMLFDRWYGPILRKKMGIPFGQLVIMPEGTVMIN